MNLNPLPISLGICSLLLFGSCQHSSIEEAITEGVIEYSITFPGYDPNGLMAGMLPDKTTLKFKDGKEVNELSAGMGVFRTLIVANTDEHLVDYHLSVLGKKLVSQISPGQIEQLIAQEGTKNYIYTNDVDTIAGFPCKKAIVIFDEIEHKEIEIFYTDKIKVKEANWYNPFKEIPGVMLRYEVDQYDMRMRFEANSVLAMEVSEDEFVRLSDHESVNPERIQHELKEVLSTFSM